MSTPYALHRITIKEFKSIADLTLDLGKVNVFIGENGAGKSNILEAIGVLSAAVCGNTSYTQLKEKGVRLSAPEVFKLALKGRKRSPSFSLEAYFESGMQYHLTMSPARNDTGDSLRYWTEKLLDKSGVKIASRGSKKRGSVRDYESFDTDETTSIILAAQAMGEVEEKYQQQLDILRAYAIFAPATTVLRNISPDETKPPLGIYGGGLAKALSTMNKDLSSVFMNMHRFFPWMLNFGKTRPTDNLVSHHAQSENVVVAFQDKRMSKNFNKLLAYDVSEGVLYVLFLLCLISHRGTPPFFAVDNLDAALNPRLACEVLRVAIELIKDYPDKQMLFTTHNPSMINALDLFDEDQRLFVVERSKEDGSTTVRRINPAAHMTREKWQELSNGQTLSQLWSSGVLGGIPHF